MFMGLGMTGPYSEVIMKLIDKLKRGEKLLFIGIGAARDFVFVEGVMDACLSV